ncbi:hypothetical protein B0H10DRAFT_2063971 [Mycena sp. CBHHK59/15]|nr:hypothetical protein B0H10DRAFT_2063971 [Mycena sp. CBHHK59/15]
MGGYLSLVEQLLFQGGVLFEAESLVNSPTSSLPDMHGSSSLSPRGYSDLGGSGGIRTLLTVSVMSTLFYGIYFVLAVIALYLHILRYERDGGSTNGSRSVLRSPVFLGTLSLFITITIHWVMTLIEVYAAFLQTNMPPAFAFYADPLSSQQLVRNLFLRLSWIIGDLLLIHRLWTVWSHSKLVIIFPLCTWIGLIASGIGTNVVSSLRYLEVSKIFPLVHGWFTSELVFTLCTTVYCTAMLSFRIWSKHKKVQSLGGGGSGKLMIVLANIVESAALYTSWIIFNFVAYQTRSSTNFWVFESEPSVVGIANMLIYVRVGLGWTQNSHVDRLPTTRLAFTLRSNTGNQLDDSLNATEMKGRAM